MNSTNTTWLVEEISLYEKMNTVSIACLTGQQIFHINVFQCIYMRTLQNHRGRNACIKGFFPTQSAQAPAIARHESWETKFWSGCRKIIATLFRKQQKLFRHFCADDVGSTIRFIRMTAAIPKVTCHWVRRAGFQGCSNNVDSHSEVFFS